MPLTHPARPLLRAILAACLLAIPIASCGSDESEQEWSCVFHEDGANSNCFCTAEPTQEGHVPTCPHDYVCCGRGRGGTNLEICNCVEVGSLSTNCADWLENVELTKTARCP